MVRISLKSDTATWRQRLQLEELFTTAPKQYVTREAYDIYLINNPHNESRFVFPLDEGEWQDAEDSEIVAEGASEIVVRGQALTPNHQRHTFDPLRDRPLERRALPFSGIFRAGSAPM